MSYHVMMKADFLQFVQHLIDFLAMYVELSDWMIDHERDCLVLDLELYSYDDLHFLTLTGSLDEQTRSYYLQDYNTWREMRSLLSHLSGHIHLWVRLAAKQMKGKGSISFMLVNNW